MDNPLMPKTGHEWCAFLSAICALVAAVLWFVAALHPVAKPGPPFYGAVDPRTDPTLLAIQEQARKIERGAMYNACAAVPQAFRHSFSFFFGQFGGADLPMTNPAIQEVLSYVAQFFLVAGGGAAVAVALVRFFGKSWIENQFAKSLEAFKHEQAIEIARLRVEVESMLSGAIRVQQLEFEVLPEAWRLLDESFALARWITSGMHQYTVVESLAEIQLNEVMDKTLPLVGLSERMALSNLTGDARQKRYERLIRRRDLNRALKAANELDQYTASKGIFLPKTMKAKFREIVPIIRASLSHVDSSIQFEDYTFMRDAGTDLSAAESLVKQIESDIEARLQSHAGSYGGASK